MRSKAYPRIYALARAASGSMRGSYALFACRGDWTMGIVVRGCEGRSWLDSGSNVYVFSSMEVLRG